MESSIGVWWVISIELDVVANDSLLDSWGLGSRLFVVRVVVRFQPRGEVDVKSEWSPDNGHQNVT